MNRTALFSTLIAMSFASSAGWADEIIKVGKDNAPKGGTFYEVMSSEPTTLHPLTATDLYSRYIHNLTFDGLMVSNVETYEMDPGLAERADESKDGKTITFYLRKDAKWHDGKPVTAEDVKFSFDAIRDPQYKALHMIPYFDNIDTAEVLDPHTVRFNIKKKYFNNFKVLASAGFLKIIPKHVYGTDKGKKMNKDIVGSGPYKLEKYDKGRSIAVVRNKDWWGFNVDHTKNAHNFDRWVYRFVKEQDIQLEMLKKGDIDLYKDMGPEMFAKKAVGKPFGDTVLKKQVENLAPKSYGFVGWNFKNPMFQDRDVRLALAHLMNRDMMNEKFRFGMSLPATGPWYQQSPYANPKVKAVGFDNKKAQELLKKAGWTDSDKDGVLDKVINGKKTPLKFTLLFPNRDVEKYFTLYKEDLKKAGIDMELKVVEWNSFIKLLDEKNFEAIALAWGSGSVDNDPKQIWHSESAGPGGSNFISYNNPKVDALIEQGRAELDKQKRIKIYQDIYKMIADDAPYAFLFNEKFVMYANNKRIQQEKPTYKYDVGVDYWWVGQ